MTLPINDKSGSEAPTPLGRFCVFVVALLALALPVQAGPLSERVLLVAPVNGLDKLFICRPDGRDLRRFSSQRGDQTSPTYSRTLERVFYVRPYKGRSQICSVDLEGGDFKLEVALNAEARYPDVSPDGSKVVFASDLWGAMELAELDRESGEVKRLTYDQTVNTHPRYSPDGEEILFLSHRTGRAELFLFTPRQPAFRQLTDTPFSKGAPAWNPTGTRIVYTEAIPPKLRSALVELDLESGKRRFLLPKTRNVGHPKYSADGSQIIFVEAFTLYTFDPADTTALDFPIRGELNPLEAIWVTFPLP